MRPLLLLTAMTAFTFQVAHAQDNYIQGDARDAGAITTNTADESAIGYLKTFGQQVNKITQDDVDVAQVAQKMNLANECSMFVDNNGNINQWGQVVEQALNPKTYPDIFTGPRDLLNICPAYKAMNTDDRQSVWILILENMANYESSCNPKSVLQKKSPKNKNGAPNGTAAGLLSLNRGHESGYDKDPAIGNPTVCKNGDASTPARTLDCALSMLNLQIAKGNTLFDNSSYWAVLRPNEPRNPNHPTIPNAANRIMTAIRDYPPCGSKVQAGVPAKPGNVANGKTPVTPGRVTPKAPVAPQAPIPDTPPPPSNQVQQDTQNIWQQLVGGLKNGGNGGKIANGGH